MLGASLQHRGEELLGHLEDLQGFAAAGKMCGIPLLYPWANRLAGTTYDAAGQRVSLASFLLASGIAPAFIGQDEHGLPIHGVPWSRLAWQVTGQDLATLKARLEWNSSERLAVFPFPHRVEMMILLNESALTIETSLMASVDIPVPVSFGLHPYFCLPGLPRAEWQVRLPEMRHLLLDERNIPTGEVMPYAGFDELLGEREFDDGFALFTEPTIFSLEGNGRRITVEFLDGYPCAQVFAPRGKDYIAFEPMTAPTNALVSGRGLRLVAPGEVFRAAFHIGIEVLT
jgi:aldose 1-epimerase